MKRILSLTGDVKGIGRSIELKRNIRVLVENNSEIRRLSREVPFYFRNLFLTIEIVDDKSTIQPR